MKIKEPFLLIAALLGIGFCFLPSKFYMRRNGEPYGDLLIRRIAFAGIGIVMLVLWYSLSSK
jgi:hypothetical protein